MITTPPQSYSGRFITLDGSEGVGKSTQIAKIADWLKSEHIPYILTREPGGTNLGEKLRNLLLDLNTQADEISELLLILAARRQHLVEKIWPALKQGYWVISDRFNDATYAYQGYGRGIDLNTIFTIEQAIKIDFEPDKRFIFTLEYSAAQTRLEQRATVSDRFEQEQKDFFERIGQGFLQRAKGTNAILIDVSASIDSVFAQIRTHLESLR